MSRLFAIHAIDSTALLSIDSVGIVTVSDRFCHLCRLTSDSVSERWPPGDLGARAWTIGSRARAGDTIVLLQHRALRSVVGQNGQRFWSVWQMSRVKGSAGGRWRGGGGGGGTGVKQGVTWEKGAGN